MKRSRGRALAATVAVFFLGLSACAVVPQQPAVPAQSGSGAASATPTSSPSESKTPSAPVTRPASVITVTWPAPTPTPTPTPTPEASTLTPTPPHTTAAPPSKPSCTIPASLLGKDIEAIPTKRKVIALTFDAGSIDAGADKILATLSKEGVLATFFLTGRFARAYPKTSRRIANVHLIGNHTQTHPDMTKLTNAAIRSELAKARRAIIEVTGKDPKPYFRFPYGEVNARTIRVVNGECYVPFRWTTDTLGWQGTSGGRSVASVTKRVLDGAKPGGIVLMHVGTNPDDGSTLDADALPGIIKGLRAKGYSFVSLDAIGLPR